MLKLFWNPANWVGVPADPKWSAMADVLTADAYDKPALQAFQRGADPVQPPSQDLANQLDRWLQHRDPTWPVTIVAHGFMYDPTPGEFGEGTENPFATAYAIPSANRPAQLSLLPLVGECDEQGGTRRDTAIAFAWMSTGTLSDYARAHWDSSYKFACLDLAPLAARALAAVLAHLAHRRRPTRILAHSLGTRLTSQAIGLLKAAGIATSIDRIVFLEGAEFCVDAAANFKDCAFDVVSVASSTDVVLHWGGTQACDPVRVNNGREACVIGYDGLGANPRWIDLQFDAQDLVDWFRTGPVPGRKSYTVIAQAQDRVHPNAGMGHWACYTNPTNRTLVHDLVLDSAMTGQALRAANVPNQVKSEFYGTFGGVPVPPTPSTAAERQPREAAFVIGGDNGPGLGLG